MSRERRQAVLDSKWRKKILKLDPDLLGRLNELVGKAYGEWVHLAKVDGLGARTGRQLHLIEQARGAIHKHNRQERKVGGDHSLFQENPEARFIVNIYNVHPEGAEYLYTSIQCDAGGVVLQISRRLIRDDIAVEGPRERPGLLYYNDEFTEELVSKMPDFYLWADRIFRPSSEAQNYADLILQDLSEITKGSFIQLPLDDGENMQGPASQTFFLIPAARLESEQFREGKGRNL